MENSLNKLKNHKKIHKSEKSFIFKCDFPQCDHGADSLNGLSIHKKMKHYLL